MSKITYKKAGVDIAKGDLSSKIAYTLATSTFSSRKGMIGEPVTDNGGFTGLMDMGDFYITQCDDGVGTKIAVAESINKFDTLGYDLLAMVCDDNICIGAETISITNTLDTNKLEPKIVEGMMKGLAKACKEQKIVIPGGEIAELGKLVNGNTWNATAVGVIAKDKLITGKNIKPGDKIISLYEPGFRSNGFSLVRYILENKFGKNAYSKKCSFSKKTWGKEVLIPSTIYSGAILNLIGRFGGKKQNISSLRANEVSVAIHVQDKSKSSTWIASSPSINSGSSQGHNADQFPLIKGIAHITGGGIPGNLNRILKRSGVGANLNNLWKPSKMVSEIQKLGNIEDSEAYKSWNMCNGMMIVCEEKNCETIISSLKKDGIKAQIAGYVIKEKKIIIQKEKSKALSFNL